MIDRKPFRWYQDKALKLSKDKEGFAFFMEQRTGKTPVAIRDVERWYNQERITACIVVAPKNALHGWEGDVEQEEGFAYWFEGDYLASRWRGKKDPMLTQVGGQFLRVFLINFEALVSTKNAWDQVEKILKLHKCALIIDESHKIKTFAAKRTKRCLEMADKSAMVRILTGTPADESPVDLWTQGKAIGVQPWLTSQYAFRNRYAELEIDNRTKRKVESNMKKLCFENGLTVRGFEHKPGDDPQWLITSVIETDFGKVTGGVKRAGKVAVKIGVRIEGHVYWKSARLDAPAFMTVTRYRNVDELQAILKPYSYRITRREAWDDMPEKTYGKLEVAMGKQQLKIYNELKNDMRIELASKEITATLAITMIMKLQQVVGGYVGSDDGHILEVPDNNRIKDLIEYLKDLDCKAVIWSRRTAEIDGICRAMKEAGMSHARYDGSTAKTRDADKVRFQKGELLHFVGNQAAGETALDLSVAQVMIYYSNHDSLTMRKQSEDRCTNTTNRVHVVDMISPEVSTDPRLITALRRKQNLSATLTGDEVFEWI